MNTLVALPEGINLFYKDDKSDKVYQARLEQQGKGWTVGFSYGRRGSTLTTGTKCVDVPYEKAKKAYEKVITEKKAKGYTEDPTGKIFAMSHNEATTTGVFPQLLNTIEEEEVQAYIKDDNWCMQQKHDGKRMMLRKTGEKIEAINRRGLTCGLPTEIETDLQDAGIDFLVDGECVGNQFFAFDLLEVEGIDIRLKPYSKRLEELCEYFEGYTLDPPTNFFIVETAYGNLAKKNMLRHAKQDNAEGIVLKYLPSTYKAGRPNKLGDQLKFKFVATASVFVSSINDKRSVSMMLINSAGKWIDVGNCTIPPNHAIPAAGSVIEVRYLYAYPTGSLYQPVYIGERDDILAGACLISQLKYKAGTEEEE